MFRLKSIQQNQAQCVAFLSQLPIGKTLKEVIQVAHGLVPELKSYVEDNKYSFKMTTRDKGSVGKIVEFYIFGQLPNCDPNPDLGWGADIKATHFKTNKNGHYNAKERVTITNCGNTDKPETLLPVANSETLETCKFYPKIQKGVLFVFKHTTGKYLDVEANLSKTLLCVFPYDISTLDEEIKEQFAVDFRDIQQKIKAGEVSQRGQKYLHIHPHGVKNSKTRAFGFTNKFITKLVSIKMNKPLTTKGRSIYIESHNF
jgi:hypothetical protein